MSSLVVNLPYRIVGDKVIIQLSHLSDTGNLRTVTINKPRHIQDEDKHHCEEVNVKGSVRYLPKKWNPLI